MSAPKILSRKRLLETPWASFIEKEILFDPKKPPDKFYSLELPDYVVAFALTPDRRVPIVRQFRPAVESYTFELPAGTLEVGESPEACCRRELREETGVETLSLSPLGVYFPDSGRLSNRQHVFFAEVSDPPSDFQNEPGLTVEFWTMGELKERIRRGDFVHQLHVSAVLLYDLIPEKP